MTERLYERDSYCREFTATVMACSPFEGGFAVTLDRTAFFPEAGGQTADTGRLGEVSVLNVQLCEGVPLHTTDKPLAVGETVRGCIDWDARFQKMQKHTAEHIVCGIIHRLYGLDNVGFHLGSEDVTLDVNGELTREQLDEVERLANQAVTENRRVTVSFPEDPTTVTYRCKDGLEGAIPDGVAVMVIPE